MAGRGTGTVVGGLLPPPPPSSPPQQTTSSPRSCRPSISGVCLGGGAGGCGSVSEKSRVRGNGRASRTLRLSLRWERVDARGSRRRRWGGSGATTWWWRMGRGGCATPAPRATPRRLHISLTPAHRTSRPHPHPIITFTPLTPRVTADIHVPCAPSPRNRPCLPGHSFLYGV
ncbi:hypothetical protein JB92DRAFT_406508 [Gautieria morchelliformis]|nr:hypothetical protein JB92DRAFT_406508 [Gautieria morchelliformis]